jgi:CubicO group peptidase (beta-lactamase class C family)
MHNRRVEAAMLPKRLLLLICSLAIAAPVALRADETDDRIKAQMDFFHLPGLSLVVIKDGQVIKSRGYGLANVERRLPAQPDTVYKIGSVSKQFIATGIMLLVQDGRLGIDDPVSRHLKNAPASWALITIRHLLTHTSGLIRESPAFDPLKVQSDADVIRGAYSAPLRFAPGEKWEYSNLGYYTLAEIIRLASGQPWSEYLEAKVFMPAGLATTLPTNTTKSVPNKAIGYSGDDNARVAPDWTALRPSGAFLSTVLDLAKWDALLYTDRILSDATRQQMWAPVRLNNGATAPYGFGWHVDTVNGYRRLRHGGGIPGFAAEFVRFPELGLTLIGLTNGDDVDMASIVNGIAAVLYLPSSASTSGTRP